MTSVSIRRSLPLLSCFLAVVASAAAQNGSGFPMVGIASGQSARINALNTANQAPTNPTSCTVTLQFVDTSGKLLKQTTVNLQPGTSTSLDLSWDELSVSDLRSEVRAILLYGYSGGANPPIEILRQSVCGGLVPSLEVFDNATGRTNFILTDAKTLPPPAIPAQ